LKHDEQQPHQCVSLSLSLSKNLKPPFLTATPNWNNINNIRSKLFSSDRAITGWTGFCCLSIDWNCSLPELFWVFFFLVLNFFRLIEIVGSVDVIGFVVDAWFVFNSLLVVFLKKKKKEMVIKMHELVLKCSILTMVYQ
jgi:hypothetical protein